MAIRASLSDILSSHTSEVPLIGRIPVASAFLFDLGVFALVVGATVLMLIALAHQSVRSHRAAPRRVPANVADPARGHQGGMMEVVLALGIGALAGSGVWLILRPRTFQVIIGLSLLSYAVNLFIVAMGRLRTGAPPSCQFERPAIQRNLLIRCRKRWC